MNLGNSTDQKSLKYFFSMGVFIFLEIATCVLLCAQQQRFTTIVSGTLSSTLVILKAICHLVSGISVSVATFWCCDDSSPCCAISWNFFGFTWIAGVLVLLQPSISSLISNNTSVINRQYFNCHCCCRWWSLLQSRKGNIWGSSETQKLKKSAKIDPKILKHDANYSGKLNTSFYAFFLFFVLHGNVLRTQWI